MSPISWTAVAPEWVGFLVEVALKSALLIAGLLLVDRLLGDRRASWRNLLWIAALAGLVLIPLASAWGPALRVPIFAEIQPLVTPGPSHPIVLEVPQDAGTPLQAALPTNLPTATAVTEARDEGWDWPSILLFVYGAGVCFCLGRLGVGLLYVASLRRQAQEVRDERLWPALQELRDRLGIRRFVRLGTSDEVGSPLQVGVFSPMAILPSRLMRRLDDQTFRAVAAHELAHIRRWDYLIHVLAMVVLAFHWFNPLAWLAVRRLHETGEHACDEWAVRLIGRYEVYARALLDVLGDMQGQRVRWGLGMAYQAEERLERIMAMKNAVPQGVGRWVRGLVLASVSMGALVLGCSAALASKQSTLLGGGKIAFTLLGVDNSPSTPDRPPGMPVLMGTALVNADGTGQEMHAGLRGGVMHAWSADGSTVVFTTVDEHDSWSGDIFLMKVGSSEMRNLTKGKYPSYSSPSISADGKKIAFSGPVIAPTGSPRSDVYVIDADGSNMRNLSNSPDPRASNRMPAISPDGKWVAFSSDRLYKVPGTFSAREGVIFLVDTEGNNLHPLTSTTGIISYEPYIIPNLDWDPAWSPDGEHIAWSNGGDIWIIDTDGTQPRRLTASWKTDLGRPARAFTLPAWSPDGTKIAMQVRLARDGNSPWADGGFGICVVDVDGSNLRLVTGNQDAHRPSWFPAMASGFLGPR